MSALPLPLVPASHLVSCMGEPGLRIVDCRWALDDPSHGPRAYAAGHVPGAVWFSVDEDLSAPPGAGRHPLPEPDVFAARLAEVGIGNDHTVVAYDDVGGGHAARLWWMLRSLGHPRAGVLDGGWRAWVEAGGPVETVSPQQAPTIYTAPPGWSGVVDRGAVAARAKELTLVDARASARYRGVEEPIDPVAGHIPGAHSLPSTDNLDDEERFLPIPVLQTRFAHLDNPIVVYCGSGVTACHDILAMEIAGIEGALLYPGSWSDWVTAGGAVETGPDPHGPHVV